MQASGSLYIRCRRRIGSAAPRRGASCLTNGTDGSWIESGLAAPRRGASFIARRSRRGEAQTMTPGKSDSPVKNPTPQGSPNTQTLWRPLAGSFWGWESLLFPGVFGARRLDHRAMNKRPLRGRTSIAQGQSSAGANDPGKDNASSPPTPTNVGVESSDDGVRLRRVGDKTRGYILRPRRGRKTVGSGDAKNWTDSSEMFPVGKKTI